MYLVKEKKHNINRFLRLFLSEFLLFLKINYRRTTIAFHLHCSSLFFFFYILRKQPKVSYG